MISKKYNLLILYLEINKTIKINKIRNLNNNFPYLEINQQKINKIKTNKKIVNPRQVYLGTINPILQIHKMKIN